MRKKGREREEREGKGEKERAERWERLKYKQTCRKTD